MKIAIEGCAHGELELIYESIKAIEDTEKIKVDLLICCGDFQAARNKQDLKCMAVPPKYQNLGSFYKYYSGEKTAPILTIFIGGNHEASNYLQELPYGGWVAPNIYYLGYCGVVNVGGIRIAGISGIYKGQDYFKGKYEIIPYNNYSLRSVYHIRQLDVYRLKQLSSKVDIFVSHDWPAGICDYGNVDFLTKIKPFLKNDIESKKLGSPPCEEILKSLKPSYWFSAHLHCKFAALVPHADGEVTRFLALDKCLPRRKFLQIVNIPQKADDKIELSYDLEWLYILSSTNHLLHVKNSLVYMPADKSDLEADVSKLKKDEILKKFDSNLVIPQNFTKTALFQDELTSNVERQWPKLIINPQTSSFCEKLNIDDPIKLILGDEQLSQHLKNIDQSETNANVDSNIFLDMSEDFNYSDATFGGIESYDSIGENEEVNDSNVQNFQFPSLNTNESENLKKIDEPSPTNKKFKRRNAIFQVLKSPTSTLV